ncbi:hypothetical protein T12_6613 [Trichinella patagoniensis]|uniref:Uncharacterized protein n=1 Tax=Trichinella patagoniensis TaxID=990121 RepID=A0A0V0Z9C0_9BILA|nr:hypothetical protein T12_8694 [Trichinella patagoniensis]KRY09096.1 hypothetical protein T12_6613 [Trichinella patagoniensis]
MEDRRRFLLVFAKIEIKKKDERRINRVLCMNFVVGKSRFICQFDRHYTGVPAVSRTLIVIKPRAESETAEKGERRTHGARHQLAAQACTSKN